MKLATVRVVNLPIKILLLSNQHLSMVVQWEYRFYRAYRTHTDLGNPSKAFKIFPICLNLLKHVRSLLLV